MDKIQAYAELMISYARYNPYAADSYYHSAFGAIDFCIYLNPTYEQELMNYWYNEVAPLFDEIMGR